MRNKLSAALALVAMAIMLQGGCVADDAAPPKVVYDPVPTPTPTACVATADVPVEPDPLGARPPAISGALDAAVAKVKQWEKYGSLAGPILKACAQ